MQLCAAQNSLQTQWSTQGLEQLVVSLPHASSIQVFAHEKKQISVQYRAEGEYQNRLRLGTKVNNNQLVLSESRAPGFAPFHDKLSAHKVLASTLKIGLPKDFPIRLKAANAIVDLDGNLHRIDLEVLEGEVHLNASHVYGSIRTQSAPIFATQLKEKPILLWPKQEKKVTPLPRRDKQLFLQSLRGKIFVQSNGN